MIFKRVTLAEAAEKYLRDYLSYDPYQLGRYVRKRVLEWMAKRDPRRLTEYYSEIVDLSRMFAHNSLISALRIIASTILDTGYHEALDKKSYKLFLTTILDLLERGDKDSLDLQSRALSLDLNPGTEAYTPTPGSVAETVIVGARSKLDYVRTSHGEPLLHGAAFAEKLCRQNVKAISVPDTLRYWAIYKSHIVIVSAYASTLEGLLVTDFPVESAVKLAWRLGKKVYIIHPWSGVLASYTSTELEYNIPKDIGPVYDVLDPEEGPLYLVTDKFVVNLSRELVQEYSDQARRAIREIARMAFNSVTEGG